MRGSILSEVLFPDRNVVQYTCESDHDVGFLHDKMLDDYCQILPYSRFDILDVPHVAENFGKI